MLEDSSTVTMSEIIEEVTQSLAPHDCTKINDLKILRAISKGISFSFEITGQTYPKHYLTCFNTARELYPDDLDYDIYISGVFVPSFSDLLERNLSRFKKEYKNYNADRSANSAPRLPELTHIMHNNIATIIKNIKAMHEKMIDKNEEKITRMLLYSNIDSLICEFDSLNILSDKNLDTAVDILYNRQSQKTVAETFYRNSFLKEMSSHPPLILGPVVSVARGGRRRTSKSYKRRRRTQKKKNYKRNYNTKKTRNKRRKC